MKSLDEHLRDASQAWTQEATPTLVTSADAIAKTLRPRSWMFPWGLGTLGLGVVAAVTFYVSQTPTAQSVTAQSVTAQSGTAQSATSKSGTAQPEMPQPSMSQPSMSQPLMSQT